MMPMKADLPRLVHLLDDYYEMEWIDIESTDHFFFLSGQKNSFRIVSPATSFYVRAFTPAQKTVWMGALHRCIARLGKSRLLKSLEKQKQTNDNKRN